MFYWKIKNQDLCYPKQICSKMYVVLTHDPGQCQDLNYWGGNIGSGNCLVLSGNKPKPKLNQAPISRKIFHRDSYSTENWSLCNSIIGYHIPPKCCTFQDRCCTCHNSTAVVPCAKFHSDHFNTNPTREEWHFHRTWIIMDKLFKKMGPDLCRHTALSCYNVAWWHHIVTQNWVDIGSVNCLLPDGTIPLPEPILMYHL